MKKFLLVLLASSFIHAQTTLEKCGAGSCYGYGPPTGAAANGYIYQDVSQTIPALYCAKNNVWVTCGGTGASPAGTFNDVQMFGTSSSLAADSGNLQNDSTAHNFHQKKLNGIPFAGNYTTGSNGINNAFSAIGNTGVVINNSENAGDTTNFGPGTNSTIIDLQNGTLGHRLHNCVPNNFLFPNDGNASVCESDIIQLDTPFTANGLGGLPFKGLSTFTTGAGINNGNIGATDNGWSNDGGQWWQTDSFRDGISNVLTIEGKKFSLGDFQGIESRIWTMGGGNTDISAEGANNIIMQGGQPTFYPTGTVTTTTGAGDVTPTVNVNHFISSGTYMIDTQTASVSGALATGGGLWSESTYLSLLPTTAAVLTPSTGDCVTTQDVHLSTVVGVPQSHTFTCTVGLLGQLTTGFAYITSVNSLAEGITITSAPAPVAGVQTITALTALAHFSGSNVIQGGTHGCLSFDQNLSTTGVRSSYTVFGAKDSTHMIYGYLIEGKVLGNTIPMIGNEPETLTAGSNGFHVFPCAQVAYINPGSFGLALHLRQNDVVWHNGDTIEFPPNPAVNMHQVFSDHQVLSPSNGSGSQSAFFQYHGFGVTGNYTPLTLLNQNSFNGSSGMYQVNGGWAIAPTAINVQGAHDIALNLSENPFHSIININSDHGVPYNVVQSGAGNFQVDSANSRYIFTQNLNVSSGLSAQTVSSFSGSFNQFYLGPLPVTTTYNCVGFMGTCALTDSKVISGNTANTDPNLYLDATIKSAVAGNVVARSPSSGSIVDTVDFGFNGIGLYTASGGTSTRTAGISQPSAGVLSVDTTAVGNGLGTIKAAKFQGSGTNPSIATGTASNTDVAGQLTLAAGTATFTFAGTYTSAPICVATDTTATNAVKASATTTVLTLTGTGTDVLNYVCIGRN